MRWLFLLLLVLNVFYAVWHQQEVPQQPVEIQALSMYKGSQQDIRLLSESRPSAPVANSECLYLGGYPQRTALSALESRLFAMGAQAQAQVINGDQGAVHWLKITPQTRHLLGESTVAELSREFNELKHQIMPCEGIATDE
jgi:hypothetical protein